MKKDFLWILVILVVFMGFFVFGVSSTEGFGNCRKNNSFCVNSIDCCSGKCIAKKIGGISYCKS
jgi:hypothetical protein